MRKTDRIDQILIRLGYATQAQMEQALERQRAQGGRIGENLIEIGAITEEQLFDGLVEQFRVPTITVDEDSVPDELLERMPEGALGDSLIVPVGWNRELGVLSIAVANPSDTEAIEEVRRAFGAKKVRVSLAPEGLLADLVLQLGGAERSEDGGTGVRLVALPELFEPEEEAAAVEDEPTLDRGDDARRVLMLTRSASRRNFLPAVFKSEGVELVVVSDPEEITEALGGPSDSILVAEDMVDTWRAMVREGAVDAPAADVVVFDAISTAVLDNPASYGSLSRSLKAGVQALAEYRCAAEGVSVPYALMAADLEALAERRRLGPLAEDGLVLGLHLLMPVERGTSIDPFRSFAATIELAHRIRFAWPMDKLLGVCLGLYLGRVDLDDPPDGDDEVLLSAQLLALVWYRHILLEPEGSTPEEAFAELRIALRELAGRLAPLDVIESYIEILGERAESGGEVAPRSVLLVGGERLQRTLAPALQRVGAETATATNMVTAQAAVEGSRPDAIVVDHEKAGEEVERVCRILRVDRKALLFVLTDESDPALVLNLLDLGVDDVFAPPHDFDVIGARVLRALRSRAGDAPAAAAPEGQFSAKLEAFSFIDLAQMLAHGFKSVRVDLRRDTGEEAVLFVREGKPIHAECGDLVGSRAVYRVVSWEEEGEFSVHDVDAFPDATIDESIESLLMEGVRLLDESRS